MKQKFYLNEVALLAIISVISLASFLAFHAVDAAGAIQTINGNGAANQNITRQAAGNITITNSSGVIKIGLGWHVMMDNGQAQTFTKGVTFNSGLTLGGAITGNNKFITKIGQLSWANGVNTLGTDPSGQIELGNSSSSSKTPYFDFHFGVGRLQDYNVRIINDQNTTLTFFANKTGTNGLQMARFSPTSADFTSNVSTGGNVLSTATTGTFKITTSGAAICIGAC